MRLFYPMIGMIFATTAWAASPEVKGLTIPSGFHAVDDNRFTASKTFASVRKSLERQLRRRKDLKLVEERSYPGVKYLYIRNLKDGRDWDGLHFYSMKRGEVGMFILRDLSPIDSEQTSDSDQ